MNCHEFERTIIDRGCDQLMDASTEARALAHAETCARCTARLNLEQRMRAGLHAFAVEDAAINAPEKIKVALRKAFAEQHAAVASPPVSLRFARRKLLWKMAAAALLLLTTVTTVLWLRMPVFKQIDDVPPLLLAEHRELPSPPSSPPAGLADAQKPKNIHPSTVTRKSGSKDRRRTFPVKNEDAAEFFPLTFVARAGPAEFIQTIHVEISRSTLLSMGVPINIDRGEGPIKAEIIIGEDGVARAVRILN
jgi:hypothetical protein